MTVPVTALARPGPIRVASVPTGHPYVRHLADPEVGDGVVRLPDPTDPWWPPTVLDAAWIRAHAEEFDVMHVHFGFDALAPEELDAIGEELARCGRPLVVTVHDLRNPHHLDAGLHDLQLGALLRHAARVLTLTAHAAEEIGVRFGRVAEVVTHPHIVELVDLRHRQARRRPDDLVVGVHLKSLRPNIDPAVVDAALAGVRRVPGAVLRVDLHRDVADPTGDRHDADLVAHLRRLSDHDEVDLHVHDVFDDGGLFDYLASLHASVLPYRFGTHSGWLEACRDLGVAVVAPDCGSYHDQGPVTSFRCGERDGLDHDGCAGAVERALRAPRSDPVPWAVRLGHRRHLAERHRAIYRAALREVDAAEGAEVSRHLAG